MGTTVIEFVPGELRIVGGDYGQIVFEGNSEAARRALDQIVAATRRGDDRVGFGRIEFEYDESPDLFENRHAGRSSEETGEFRAVIDGGAIDRSEDSEGAAARHARKRRTEGGA